MKYKPHIDGLRAVAVIAVVIYHAGFNWLSGGFLGVDIFFVISGFLITSNILIQQDAGNFTLLEFYKRRLKRLLPVLYFILAVTSFFAWRYLLPGDLIEYAKSLAATIGFGSNFWFYFQDNYHAVESSAKPLLHTWSLGVEEQFYLFFPMLLIIINRIDLYGKGLILAGIAFCSILLANNLSVSAPEASFYLLPTRLWELMIGAILAIILIIKPLESSRLVNSFLSLLGLGLILYSYVSIDSSDLHPSFVTLIPVIGSVILIAYAEKSLIISFLLSNYIITYIGRLSYSIYLWHFPVFAFSYVKNLGDPLAFGHQLALIGLVLILSVFSYHVIEKPFRFSNKFPDSLVLGSIVGSATAIVVFSVFIVMNDGYENRLGELEAIFEGTDTEDSFLTKNNKRCFYQVANPLSCHFAEFPEGQNLINIGDSHANAISVPLYQYARNSGMNFYNVILSHCPYIVDAWRVTGFKAKCEDSQMEIVREYLKSIEPSTLVYMVRFPYYLNYNYFDNQEGGVEKSLYLPFYPNAEANERGEDVSDLIVKTLNEMGEMGHKVVLVYPIPEVGWHIPNVIKDSLDKVSEFPLGGKQAAFERMSITTSYKVYKERIAYTKSILDRVNNENIIRVFPDKIFCSEESGRCMTHNKDTIYYYDDDHLSQSGAKLLVDVIAEKLN